MPPVVARRPHAGRPPPSTPRRPRRVLPVQVPCLPGPPCRSRSARREREPLPPRVSAGMVGDRDRARVLLAICCPTTPSRRCKPLVRPPACAAPRGRRQTAPPRRRPPRRRIGRTPLLSQLGACGEDHGVHAGVFSAATPNAKLPMNKTTVIGNFMEMRLLYDLGNCSVLTQRKRVLRPRQLRAAGSSPGTSAFT